MYSYSIVLPFKMNWKYAAPKTFETIEYFITPTISLGLTGIVNGKNQFAIGAFLVEGQNKKRFTEEFLPKRSQERINKAFAQEEISCFFTEAEAKELTTVFEEEKFICHRVEILQNGKEVDLFSINEEDFELVLKVLAELGVQQVLDIKSERESFETLRTDMYDKAYQKARNEFMDRYDRTKYPSGTKWRRVALVGSGFMVLAVALRYASKFLIGKGIAGTFFGFIAYAASMVSGIFGFKLLNTFVDTIDEGVIFI